MLYESSIEFRSTPGRPEYCEDVRFNMQRFVRHYLVPAIVVSAALLTVAIYFRSAEVALIVLLVWAVRGPAYLSLARRSRMKLPRTLKIDGDSVALTVQGRVVKERVSHCNWNIVLPNTPEVEWFLFPRRGCMLVTTTSGESFAFGQGDKLPALVDIVSRQGVAMADDRQRVTHDRILVPAAASVIIASFSAGYLATCLEDAAGRPLPVELIYFELVALALLSVSVSYIVMFVDVARTNLLVMAIGGIFAPVAVNWHLGLKWACFAEHLVVALLVVAIPYLILACLYKAFGKGAWFPIS